MKPVTLDSTCLLGYRIISGRSRQQLGGKISQLPGKGGNTTIRFSGEIGGKIGNGKDR